MKRFESVSDLDDFLAAEGQNILAQCCDRIAKVHERYARQRAALMVADFVRQTRFDIDAVAQSIVDYEDRSVTRRSIVLRFLNEIGHDAMPAEISKHLELDGFSNQAFSMVRAQMLEDGSILAVRGGYRISESGRAEVLGLQGVPDEAIVREGAMVS